MNQLQRLTYENQVLQHDGMPQFQIYSDQTNGYYLWGEHRTNAHYSYPLWSPIPVGFPYSRPPLYIRAPNPLGHSAYLNHQ